MELTRFIEINIIMNILHVLDCSIPNVSGYASRSKYIVEFQKKIGITPTVITSPLHKTLANRFELINDIEYYRSTIPPNYFNNVKYKIPFLRQFALVQYLKKEINKIVPLKQISLLHAHSPVLWGLSALAVAKKYKVPLIYEVRALWEDAAVDQEKTKEGDIRYRLTKMLETRLMNRADAVVTICEGLKEEILRRGIKKEKVYVVPNGVDTEAFKPLQKNLELNNKYNFEEKIIIGFIGTFYNFEGVEHLIRAFPKILNSFKKVKLLIVGGGKEENNLKKLVQDSHMEENILLTGKIPHDEILKYYSIIDVLVYPRLKKRITDMVTPLKPLEAMSMEKAVIASDVGGLKELITDKETGLLFKADNIEDLADKCLILLNNGRLRSTLGQNARLKMKESRDWSKIIPSYVDLYKSILALKENKSENY